MLYRIYPSILNSFWDYKNVTKMGGFTLVTYENLILRLNRISTPRTLHQRKGMALEQCLQKSGTYGNDGFVFTKELIDELYSMVKGSIASHVVDCTLKINNDEVNLYGIMDFIKGQYAIDLKGTKQVHAGKFRNSFQHRAYMQGLRSSGIMIDEFIYLTTDYKDIFNEHYQWQESFKNDLENICWEFIEFINKEKKWICNPKLFGK